MKNLFIKIIITLFVFLVTFTCNADNTDNNSDLSELIIKKAQTEYNNSQFLVEVARDGHSNMVSDFLWLIDHSIYEVSITNWNKFVKNYTRFYGAYRAYKQGFNVEFDDILN